MDYLSIPGATISTLHHALLVEYGRVESPVGICLIAGLSDRIAERVVKDILWMRKSVEEKFRQDSTFAVCTLQFALHVPSGRGERDGLQTNKLEELTARTRGIKNLNRLGGHSGSF